MCVSTVYVGAKISVFMLIVFNLVSGALFILIWEKSRVVIFIKSAIISWTHNFKFDSLILGQISTEIELFYLNLVQFYHFCYNYIQHIDASLIHYEVGMLNADFDIDRYISTRQCSYFVW